MTQRLFVYGTLGPSRPNEHVLAAIGGTWQEASVKGYLKPRGWGADLGYPGIVLDDEGNEVAGYLFCSDSLHEHWHELDAFEGDEYERVLIRSVTKDAEAVEAFVYVLAQR